MSPTSGSPQRSPSTRRICAGWSAWRRRNSADGRGPTRRRTARRSVRPDDGARRARSRLGKLDQQGIPQALELELEPSDMGGALLSELRGADAAPAEAEIEQRRCADVGGAA